MENFEQDTQLINYNVFIPQQAKHFVVVGKWKCYSSNIINVIHVDFFKYRVYNCHNLFQLYIGTIIGKKRLTTASQHWISLHPRNIQMQTFRRKDMNLKQIPATAWFLEVSFILAFLDVHPWTCVVVASQPFERLVVPGCLLMPQLSENIVP